MINLNIQKGHVLKALSFIDENGVLSGRKSVKYHLAYKGKNYPPKYVISLANKFATGTELSSKVFSGGYETNNFLSKLGFIIKSKLKLKDTLQLDNYTDYKLHFATGEINKKEALMELESGRFATFQNKQSMLNFSRKYIFSLVYMNEGEWLFAGIYESLSYEMHPTDTQYKYRYKTVLTEQYQEFIGRLIVKYDKNFRQSYLQLENYIEDLVISKILDTSVLDTYSTQNKKDVVKQITELELPESYYQRAYEITKQYIDENVDLPLKEAKRLIAGNGNQNTANYHIYGIKGLLTGEKFTAKLTEEPLDFYISFITREFGLVGFKKAVVALEKNLNYRIEDLGENPNSFREFCKKYYEKLKLHEDEIEQEEILKKLEKNNFTKESLIAYFNNLKRSEQKKVEYSGSAYKRDNVTVANLKALRDFTCQICSCKIQKADGSFYVEAAHIYPKAKGGEESPRNLLILCPNHHKEFDYGQRKILKHTDEEIEFILNGVEYKIYIGII